ncbi:DUF1796 family putative cysteine peptidase [Cohnella silvisoli]|uniref:DUF1796 family putative cysteine peptidase n=1 Tax=Cohnella silvisoli TaxID=2873699 RepID=A0ABV1L436_9BACL|nr:DUF1796 family putative cysteine peptidase [Cohnella silvisoli]MCD9026425.1 papain-like cysteine peptidase [Cohnella silvisoli]
MKWKDCAGAYMAYISLGSTCQTAYQLQRLNLRKFAGPLDWFISRSVTDVARLIRNRFNGFMELNHLQVLGTEPAHFIVRDNSYDIVSYHDFPLMRRWTDAYPDFKQKLNRRVNAMITAAKNSPLCLVRIDTSMMEAQQLYAALTTIIPGEFQLLIVNNSDRVQEVRHEDWGLRHIGSVTVPNGADWRGSNFAWDQVMYGFQLK